MFKVLKWDENRRDIDSCKLRETYTILKENDLNRLRITLE